MHIGEKVCFIEIKKGLCGSGITNRDGKTWVIIIKKYGVLMSQFITNWRRVGENKIKKGIVWVGKIFSLKEAV